jgi:Ribosome biogenesis protein Nop16
MRSRKIKARRGIAKKSAKIKRRDVFLKPSFTNDAIKEQWDPKLSARKNLANIGLADKANHVVEAGLKPNESQMGIAGGERAELPREQLCETLGVAIDSEDLRELSRNSKRRPMSEADQRYLLKQFEYFTYTTAEVALFAATRAT